MSKIPLISFIVLTSFLLMCYKLLTYYPVIPVIPETWWSEEDPAKEDRNVYSFRINVSEETLNDLKYRLNHTRPFTKPLLDNQVYGFNGNLAQEILEYWQTKYDWKKREQRLNQYPHFITSIQGLKIHFIHSKPNNVSSTLKTIPLLISHGWPSSFVEYLDVISILTKPQKNRDFVFEVVLPSIPGFGFSDPPGKPGFGVIEAALVFKNLMNRLGHHQFYVHGGDMGMLITKVMATNFPDSVLGFHSNMCVSFHPFSVFKYLLGSVYPGWMKREKSREFLYPVPKLLSFLLTETGYLHSQATKPDTYGIAIDDSPMGMAVQYLEKFITGANYHYRTRKDGGLKETYDYETLFDNIMIYWVTKTGTTSYRLYSETFHGYKFTAVAWIPVKVPTACVRGPYDITSPDGIIEEVFPNLVYVADHDVGHFFGFEKPTLLASELYEGIGRMEQINSRKCERMEGRMDL